MICFATHLRQTPAPLCEGGQGWGKGFEEWVDKIDIYGVSSGSEFSPKPVFPVFFYLGGSGEGGKSCSKRDHPILFFCCDTPRILSFVMLPGWIQLRGIVYCPINPSPMKSSSCTTNRTRARSGRLMWNSKVSSKTGLKPDKKKKTNGERKLNSYSKMRSANANHSKGQHIYHCEEPFLFFPVKYRRGCQTLRLWRTDQSPAQINSEQEITVDGGKISKKVLRNYSHLRHPWLWSLLVWETAVR